MDAANYQREGGSLTTGWVVKDGLTTRLFAFVFVG